MGQSGPRSLDAAGGGVLTFSDMLMSDGAGNHGYLFERTVFVLGNPTKADDLREAALGNTLVGNETGGKIDMEFMEGFGPFVNCDVTVGGVY
jgi:hypothetical protein